LTDPLSAKELVEKTYLYVDRVAKECKKTLLTKITTEKKALSKNELSSFVGSEIEKWFAQRDKSLNIKWDRSSFVLDPKNRFHLVFRGANKDAKFELSCDGEVFADPFNPERVFIKSLDLKAERTKFQRA
jgi:endo-beta-N-acetylglucosaminidase D